ncbi:MAG: hypothetical protein LW698_07250, partial [Planctomycetaceae bacterium]|nr:hypothetical protein [Planctomycetaceae bacterium]
MTPLEERQEFRVKLAVPKDGSPVTIRLAAGDAGDGRDHDVVVWRNPRLVAPGRADLPLSLVRSRVARLAADRARVASTAAKCLAAVSEAMAEPAVPAAALDAKVAALAEKHAVDPRLLAAWLAYLGFGATEPAFIGLLDKKLEKVAGWDAVNGWRGQGELRAIANSSDEPFRIPGTVDPHSVVVHPDVKHRVIVGWRSPITGAVEIRGKAIRAHRGCGNGTAVSVEVWRGKTREALTSDANREPAFGPFGPLPVRKGEVVAVVVGARDGDASCDLTRVELTIRAGDREWDLARDVSADILASNPHVDRQGNANVWHFAAEPEGSTGGWTIPTGSLLARWRSAAGPTERATIAAEFERLLAGDGAGLGDAAGLEKDDSPDARLRRLLLSPLGPLLSGMQPSPDGAVSPADKGHRDVAAGLDPAVFGRHPQGLAAEAHDLCMQAPHALTCAIPADLVEGCELVVEGTLHPAAADDASVQLEVAANPGDAAVPTGLVPSLPIVARKDSAAWRRFEAAFTDFRSLFPQAVCYGRIVPVDEVITLNLYYREDDHLRRLMLNEAEAKELDRLWDELLFIA